MYAVWKHFILTSIITWNHKDDKITIENLESIAPDASVNITIEKTDGETKDIKANHSLSDEQIEWFKAGSALNSI